MGAAVAQGSYNGGCGAAAAVLTRAARAAAAGDDEGHVRLWDTRTRARVSTFRVHEDFVADMHLCTAKNTLLTASGDGTLAILDLRWSQVTARSDNQEDELLSGARPRSRGCVGRLRVASAASDDSKGLRRTRKGLWAQLYA